MGQEKVLDSRRDGWPLRGHFLPGNILLGSGREEAPVQEGRKGLGLKSLVPSSPQAGPGKSQEGMSSWMSEPLSTRLLLLPTHHNLELLSPSPG